MTLATNPLDDVIKLLPERDVPQFKTPNILDAVNALEKGEDINGISTSDYLQRIEQLEKAVEEAAFQAKKADRRAGLAEELSRQAKDRADEAERVMHEARDDLRNVLGVLRRAALQSATAQKKIVDMSNNQLPSPVSAAVKDLGGDLVTTDEKVNLQRSDEVITLICYVLEQDRRANIQTANVISRVLGLKEKGGESKGRRFKATIRE